MTGERKVSPTAVVLPLALAQFVASYAGTNMNVAISTIANDIGTTVIGMQTTITLFTLTMASLMIAGSKLTESSAASGASSAMAERMASRRSQRTLVRAGFVIDAVGMAVLLIFGRAASPWALAPGLLLMGADIGIMLTASVNVVQSALPEQDQNEISGVSRSVSNSARPSAPRWPAPSWSPPPPRRATRSPPL